ncbi:serine/threonine-protein phosphatase 4 regulatory subunit 4-like [Adelges cooleyi]|uniref:serine/threonine-protein phosphatase 4 regulatory subunit 4-like n=1 Tax=Adelges cooleyi TaxID=133065 RepID=UPI00218066D8|nr:serine/threonine-protein phosphatase 4 regulatory subunit 4-like [Adelges cooleyi]
MQENESKELVEFHYETTETMRNILKKQLLSADLFQQTFLSTILSALDNSTLNNDCVTNTWLDTLLDFIEFLPTDCLQKEILPFAIERSELSKPEALRLISCRIFGSLATKLNSFIVKREIWPCILSLCQDESVLVRKTVCQELSKVGAILKENTNDSNDCILLPAIVDLANNADCGVKVALLDVIVDIIPCFPNETIVSVILPLVKKLFDTDLKSANLLTITVSKNIGVICKALKDYLELEDVTWFINKYVELLDVETVPCLCPNDNSSISEISYANWSIRTFCAASLPDIVLFTSSDKSSTTLLIYLINHLVDLVSDEYVEVRIALASVIKEVLISLNDKVVLISTVLMKLLTERDTRVLKIMIPNLSFIIMKMKYQEQVLKSLMQLEEYLCSQYNWRLYAEFLHQIMVLPACYSSDLVYIVGKVMIDRFNTVRQKPIKEAVCTLLLTILRYNLDADQRTLIRENLIDRTVNNSNFYKRVFYVFVCQEAMNIFSAAYFKKHFLMPLLSLADDKTKNIRYGLCTIMPRLVNILSTTATEKILLNRLNGIINQLMTDEDRTIRGQLQNLEYCRVTVTLLIRGKNSKPESECTYTDGDMLKFREESRLLLMKSCERINLENGGIFLRSLIEEKMSHNEPEKSPRTSSNENEKIGLADKKAFMLESEFIKDTGVSINKMIEHSSSKIPTPVQQPIIGEQSRGKIHKEKSSFLPMKKARALPMSFNFQRKPNICNQQQQVVTRVTNVVKRNGNKGGNRSKRLSVPAMSNTNAELTKDANGNLVKYSNKRPQSCYVDGDHPVVGADKKPEKSLSDETLDKTFRKQPLSRLPIRKSQGK